MDNIVDSADSNSDSSSSEEEYQLQFKTKSQRQYQTKRAETKQKFSASKQNRVQQAQKSFDSRLTKLFEASISDLYSSNSGTDFPDILEGLLSLSCSDSDGDAETEYELYKARELLRVKRYTLRKKAYQNGEAIEVTLGDGALIVDSDSINLI